MKYSLVSLGALAVASLGITAQAALIEIGHTYTLTSGNPVPVSTGGSGSAKLDGVTRSGGGIGVFVMTVSQSGTTLGTLSTFCTDLDIYWANNKTYEAEAFGGEGVNSASVWKVQPYALENAAYLYNEIFLNNPTKYTTSGLQGGAMQLAIWKVLYDTSDNANHTAISTFGVNDGRMTTIGGTWAGSVAEATALINQVNAARNNHTFVTYDDIWLHPVNNDSQGFLAAGTPVPEPTTIIAGALLLLPFGASTIKRIRKSAKA
jgi:hypothetical protein